jgi:ribosomal protein S18 acetylase RimI-like enzyme
LVRSRISLATPDDAPAVVGLLIAFRDWMGRNGPADGAMEAAVARVVEEPSSEFLIGRGAAGEPAGLAQVRYRWSVWTNAEDCWLEDLFVIEAARREGLGAALMEAVIERARARGCRRVELDVDADNDPALALYRRFGFSNESKGPAGTLLMGRPLV